MAVETLEQEQSARPARRKLLLIVLMPVAAIAAASLVFYTGVGIPTGTTNRGQLVQPPPQAGGLQLRNQAGDSLTAAALAGKWLILVPGGTRCDDVCRERLWLSRQVRTALGKDAQRVRRVYLGLESEFEPSLLEWLRAEHPDAEPLYAAREEWQALLAGSNAPDAAGHPLYLVDQRGFLMMAYTLQHDGQDLLKDLRFLLKYSPE